MYSSSPALQKWTMASEENQSEGTDICIITLGQLKESQEEGILLD